MGFLFVYAFIFCLVFCGVNPAFANNIAVANVSLTSQDTTNNTYDIQFDISWDNSWFIAGAPSATANWDAAWVFVKYSTYSGGVWSDWSHGSLLNTGYSAPSGSQMSFGSTDSVYKGAFIYRSAAGSGSVNWTGAKIRWSYGAVPDDAIIKVKVFAIEMVYIPQGNFYAGSGGTGTSEFYKYPTTTNPYLISSETAAINVGATTDYLYYASSTYGGDQSGPIPAAFPKGYNAFYIMKYEISQKQYADFLNTITSSQASTYYPNSNGSYRHTISGSWPNYSASRPDRACNYLCWGDIFAYADWAALRPFSELEFEKACRGGQTPVANEYGWGNTSITAASTISGTENGAETITNANANCCYNSQTFTGGDAGQGPLRCGIFATGSSTRAISGGGYYGVLELSGNLWERPVTVGNTQGRSFTGAHGDGDLTTAPSNWPSSSTALGAGFRGGNWDDGPTFARVSDRNYAAGVDAYRYYGYGARVCRASP